mgnify:CR=1 FL=1
MGRLETGQIRKEHQFAFNQLTVGLLAVFLFSETIIKALSGQELTEINGRLKNRKVFPKINTDGSAVVRSDGTGLIKVGVKEVLVFDNTNQPTPTGAVVHIGRNTVVTSRGRFFMKSGRTRYIDRGTTDIDGDGIEITHTQE